MPTPQELHVDSALTNFAVSLMPDDLVADRITGIVPVNKQSDKYLVVDGAREAFKPTKTQRAPGTAAGVVKWKAATDTYFCDEHALDGEVTDEERANADTAMQPFLDNTEFVVGRQLLMKELDLVTKASKASSGRQTAVSNGAWSAATSDLMHDVKTARIAVRNRTTRMPNVGWCDMEVWANMIHHPEVVERIVYTQSATYEAVARSLGAVLGMEAIYSVNGFQNTSLTDTPSLSVLWDRTKFFMCYRQKSLGLKVHQWVTTFQWRGGGVKGHLVLRWREQREEKDMLRVKRYYDQKAIDNDCYQEITGVLA